MKRTKEAQNSIFFKVPEQDLKKKNKARLGNRKWIARFIPYDRVSIPHRDKLCQYLVISNLKVAKIWEKYTAEQHATSQRCSPPFCDVYVDRKSVMIKTNEKKYPPLTTMVKRALITIKMRRPRNNIPPTTPSTIGKTGASVGQLTVKRQRWNISRKAEMSTDRIKCNKVNFIPQSSPYPSFFCFFDTVYVCFCFSGINLLNCGLPKLLSESFVMQWHHIQLPLSFWTYSTKFLLSASVSVVK